MSRLLDWLPITSNSHLLYKMGSAQATDQLRSVASLLLKFFFVFLGFFNCTCVGFLSGSLEWINVPNPDAESLWSREVRRTLQRRCRPPQRNQTSEAARLHHASYCGFCASFYNCSSQPLISPCSSLNHAILKDFCQQRNHFFCVSFFQHLKQQQEGLSHLISVIKDDLEDIKLIEHGLSDSGHMRGGILSWVYPTNTTDPRCRSSAEGRVFFRYDQWRTSEFRVNTL